MEHWPFDTVPKATAFPKNTMVFEPRLVDHSVLSHDRGDAVLGGSGTAACARSLCVQADGVRGNNGAAQRVSIVARSSHAKWSLSLRVDLPLIGDHAARRS